jgi:sortase A
VLLLAALSLVIFNVCEARNAQKAAQQTLDKLLEQIPDDDSDNAGELPDSMKIDTGDVFEQQEEENPSLDIDGNLYIGVLTIPDINLELPVTKEWSYANLNIALCRYYGSVQCSNMVIAGHNYTGYFDRLHELDSGAEIYFTNVHGKTFRYVVTQTEIISGYNAAAIKSGYDDWDLTLFTCTLSGYSRVTVRAVRED